MRLLLSLSILVTTVFASNPVDFFEKSPSNQLLCHVGQYSYKLVSQENAVLEILHGHKFFRLKDENLYFFNTACQPLNDKKHPVNF